MIDWRRVRQALGRIWGREMTMLLAIGNSIVPIVHGLSPDLLQDHSVLWGIVAFDVVIAVLRVVAPPPPAVSIHIDDEVSVDHDTGTVMVTKASGVPAGIADKPAGATMGAPA